MSTIFQTTVPSSTTAVSIANLKISYPIGSIGICRVCNRARALEEVDPPNPNTWASGLCSLCSKVEYARKSSGNELAELLKEISSEEDESPLADMIFPDLPTLKMPQFPIFQFEPLPEEWITTADSVNITGPIWRVNGTRTDPNI